MLLGLPKNIYRAIMKKANNYILAYYQKIVDGSILVCEHIRKLYEIIVHGIENGDYLFDNKKANDAITWIESHCFHVEGPLAPSPFKLELWQKAFVSVIFGVLDKEKKNRQFREVVLIVSRKNGKGLIGSAIAEYVWRKEGGYGAKVFCLAPKLEQADIVYGNIWQMCQIDPEWQAKKLEIESAREDHRKADDSNLERHRQSDLYLPSANSSCKKIAFSSKKSDGFNPSLTVCDEIASWEGDKGLKQYEVMKSAMAARDMGDSPSLLLSCSTAGYVNDSIYDELIKRATAFLGGNSKEKRLAPFLYIVDDPAKWNDINELRKSNPNMGVSVTSDYLLEEIAIAEGSLSKKAEFLTKYCNVKQNSTQAWFTFEEVDGCCGDAVNLESFRGSYCVAGIDLSQTTDLTSCCIVIEKHGKLNVFSRFFMPANRLEKAIAEDGVPYNIFVEQGLLTISGDNYIDYHDCENWFTELIRDYEIIPLQVGYDRFSAQYLVEDMKAQGFHMDDVIQGYNLTPVIREFEGIVKDGKLNIGQNNLLKSHLLNAALKSRDVVLRLKLVKISKNSRIDGTAALLDAMTVRQKWWSEIGQQLKNEE